MSIVYSDEQVLEALSNCNFCALDAPTSPKAGIKEGILRHYGAMPLSLPTMALLRERAIRISSRTPCPLFESFPTACAKILGVYSRDRRGILGLLDGLGVLGPVNRHTLDAALLALVLDLFLKGEGFVVLGEGLPLVLPPRFKTGP
ncbi:MAG: hypothetical protein J7J79_03940 [Thermoplasmata archaeon]|nr:hypothetical protein [Thermoplasmata archaeon]